MFFFLYSEVYRIDNPLNNTWYSERGYFGTRLERDYWAIP